MDGMVNMEKSEDQDRKIVLEFCHLLEKSKQLFNGLRYGWTMMDWWKIVVGSIRYSELGVADAQCTFQNI